MKAHGIAVKVMKVVLKRKDLLTKEILLELKKVFLEVTKVFSAELVDFDGEHDHVYLLINYPQRWPNL